MCIFILPYSLQNNLTLFKLSLEATTSVNLLRTSGWVIHHALSWSVSPFPLLFPLNLQKSLSLLYSRIILALHALAVLPVIMTICTGRPPLTVSLAHLPFSSFCCRMLLKLPSQDLSISAHLFSDLILSDLSAVFDTVTTLLLTFMSFVILICPSLLTPILSFLGVLA